MPQNEIRPSRFQQFLTKLCGIEGLAPAPILAADVQPTLAIDRLDRAEDLYLRDEIRYSCNLNLAAVPAEYWYFHLWNPANSRMLVIWEGFEVQDTGAVANFDFGPANATYIPIAMRASYAMDRRRPQNAIGHPGVAQPYVFTNVGNIGVASQGRTRSTNLTGHYVRLDYVISPGTGVGLLNPVVNRAHSGYAIWRERPMERGELA